MLWLKAFHIVFVVAWFAGLFYLPRLFVYHSQTDDELSHERFKVMERRLLAITNLGGLLALGFGIALLGWWVTHVEGYLSQGWLHLKLTLVLALLAYHHWCARLVRAFAQGRNRHSQLWYRWFNEVPVIMLIGIVVMVVVKPF
ncbi:MAG: CopD family protein [Xanthomonadales bacterium]|nr:CopD family protein [Xanthomonadales bacterium]